uniref:Uncharacterized protein n=1 Tax=Craspedostauros australis TaxID=1486917 RepID=A0A7R9WWI5_9STRA
MLYDALQRDGWKLEDERIESLSSRWYLSSRFSKLHEDASASSSQMQVAEDIETLALPGERLLPDPQGPVDDAMRTCFSQYVEHHVAWIQKDAKIGARQSESEAKWLERFQSAQESS